MNLTNMTANAIMLIMRYIFIALSVLISGCASVGVITPVTIIKEYKPNRPIADELFSSPAKVETQHQIYSLSVQQKEDFLSKYESVGYQKYRPNERIYKYLRKRLENFNFYSDTSVAKETLAANQGNCLSLAILTKTLADIAKVDIGYQLVETPALYQKESGILLGSQHIRTVLYNPKKELAKGYYVLMRGSVTVDYFPSSGTRTLRKVNQDEFFAMYYRNRAAEAIVEGDVERAYWLTLEALKVNKDDAQAINMMAIIHAKLNHNKKAEEFYRYGLQFGIEKFELLSNYHNFLKKLKREDEALAIVEELQKYDDPNPFKWIQLADNAFEKKEYHSSLRLYKKAASMADYLHQPFAGIAKTHYILGNKSSALRAFKKAIENSHQEKMAALYQAKYDLLKRNL